jgi:A/G-specific adenine glycosylase
VAEPTTEAAELPAGFAAKVQRWQRRHGRHDLPWQRSRDPYRVWLSEVMLQQTQVATVLPYFERFVERFPDVRALAAAPLDDVLALWSGLGYYSRARNLHRCAQAVVADHGGDFPRSSQALAALPGIGRSTAAAIAAFCFGERAAILDGNVKRVLTRALGFDGDLALAAQERRLWSLASTLLPLRGVDAYTQGLMDLGATVCTLRRPACTACPLHADCAARREGDPARYPVKTRKLQRGRRTHALLWLQHRGRWWLVQRPERGVWAGLWSLPEFDALAELETLVACWPGAGQWLPPVQHALTHFDWTLTPLVWRWPARGKVPTPPAPPQATGARWFAPQEALAAGLPAPLRKLFAAAAADAADAADAGDA